MQALVILCHKRELEAVVDAMEDWKEDAPIVLYGISPKTQDGFIVMHWKQGVPVRFQEMQLKRDPGVIDYLVYDLSPVLPAQHETTD